MKPDDLIATARDLLGAGCRAPQSARLRQS